MESMCIHAADVMDTMAGVADVTDTMKVNAAATETADAAATKSSL